eukprot:GHVL01008825.1.p1 GENE.GHVL01008825.1~~GHVL01008825.1.p1  ORF type:complete len:121 (-),score=11.25 GHVL01008825.1:601-963(-)
MVLYKDELDQELVRLEQKIANLERRYFERHPTCNIIKGWDALIPGGRRSINAAAGGPVRTLLQVIPSQNVFSWSSRTAPQQPLTEANLQKLVTGPMEMMEPPASHKRLRTASLLSRKSNG